jgi:hypothetical protein
MSDNELVTNQNHKRTSKVTLTNSSSIWSLIIQGVLEMRAQISTTSYWLHVELEKNI